MPKQSLAPRCEFSLTTQCSMYKSTRLDGRLPPRVATNVSTSRAKFRVVHQKTWRGRRNPEHVTASKQDVPTAYLKDITASARHSCGSLKKVHASLRALKQKPKIDGSREAYHLYYLKKQRNIRSQFRSNELQIECMPVFNTEDCIASAE